jgi:hypothetical protein
LHCAAVRQVAPPAGGSVLLMATHQGLRTAIQQPQGEERPAATQQPPPQHCFEPRAMRQARFRIHGCIRPSLMGAVVQQLPTSPTYRPRSCLQPEASMA